jgi:nucleotide-binding universal stress UspA family protein
MSDAKAGLRPKQQERVFLVVADRSEEMRVALRYAALRAKSVGGRVALFACIENEADPQWQAVADLAEQEQRDEAEARMQRFAETVAALSGKVPVIYIRRGVPQDQLLKLLDDEPSVSVLVLAAGTGRGGPGPLITALTGKQSHRLHIPLTIVPGSLSDEELEALT